MSRTANTVPAVLQLQSAPQDSACTCPYPAPSTMAIDNSADPAVPVPIALPSMSIPVARAQIDSNQAIQMIDDYYVGALLQYPVPSTVTSVWNEPDGVYESLAKDLCRLSGRMRQNIPHAKKFAVPDLYMAVQKPKFFSKGKHTTLYLRPTVWIFCGGDKCRDRVILHTEELEYLDHFLHKFGIRKVVSLHAPRLRGLSRPQYALQLPRKIIEISLAIEYSDTSGGFFPICGARARYTVKTRDGVVAHLYSTIGGAINVSRTTYGLTTAHSLIEHLVTISADGVEPLALEEDDEDLSRTDSIPGAPVLGSPDDFTLVPKQFNEDESSWIELPLPKVFKYRGYGTIGDTLVLSGNNEDTSDFALLDIDGLSGSVNGYLDPNNLSYTRVESHLTKEELVAGDVEIVYSNTSKPISGYLFQDDSLIVLPGKIMRTRKIQIDFEYRAGLGLSGAWIVRDQNLCGVLYAAYDSAPYVHMIPAHTMFDNIAVGHPDPVDDGITVASFNLQTATDASSASLKRKARDESTEFDFPWDRTNKVSKIAASEDLSVTREGSEPLGFTEDPETIFVDPGEAAEIDLVFIHGIGGDKIGTWSKGDACWPRDFLKDVIKTARIITWSYDSTALNITKPVFQETIFAHSENLLNDLARLRQKVVSNRPLIFVAHSLGGLVVKEALIRSSEYYKCNREAQLGTIGQATSGIVFMGTPHRGTSPTHFTGLVATVSKASFRQHPNKQLLNALKQDSGLLERNGREFLRISNNFEIVSFSETEKYLNMGLVVAQDFASLGTVNETVMWIPGNHMSMCRFASKEDKGYVEVANRIAQLCDKAIEGLQKMRVPQSMAMETAPTTPVHTPPMQESQEDGVTDNTSL